MRMTVSACGTLLLLVQSLDAAALVTNRVDATTALLDRAAELAVTNATAARDAYAAALAAPGLSEVKRSLALLGMARSEEARKNINAAMESYRAVMALHGAPPHHRAEAARRIEEVARAPHGEAASGEARSPAQIAPAPPPGLELHVATRGSDQGNGTKAQPFATLERARDAVRELKKAGRYPKAGVAVVVHPGLYRSARTLQLGVEDSGAAGAPITYRSEGAEAPVFQGGVKLRGFTVTRDDTVLKRLVPEARGKVMQIDLRQAGVTKILPLQLGGFGSGRGFKTYPIMELFFDGRPLPLARWPNEGFITIDKPSVEDGHSIHGLRGSKAGVFTCNTDRLLRWKGEQDVWLYGYWFWDWADSYEKVSHIDAEKREITLEGPFHTYGYRAGQKFYALNLLSEVDTPGEWFLDRSTGVLYLWPPFDPNAATIELSTAPFAFVELKNVSHVRFENLSWDLGSADGIAVTGGTNCVLAGCKITRCAGSGISISGGREHIVLSCDVGMLGRGGIRVGGGDRVTLTPSRHVIENCHIYDLSRIDHTYTPAVQVTGVGQRIAHNLMHHIRSSAINLGGNDHVVEFNEATRVVQESDDQGAVDMWGDPTFRGNVFRWNYFHHIGSWQRASTQPPHGQAGLRLDDAISGVLIYQNVFRHAATGRHGFGGVQIHGGKDNLLDDNLFIDCATAVSFSPWSSVRWLEHIEKYTGSPAINLELYLTRYPEMAAIRTDANVNHVWRNQFVNCERVLHHNRAAAMCANQVRRPEDVLRDALRSVPLRAGSVLGYTLIDRVGVYRDRWRNDLPQALIRELRSDE